MRDSREKGAGMRDQDPFQTLLSVWKISTAFTSQISLNLNEWYCMCAKRR